MVTSRLFALRKHTAVCEATLPKLSRAKAPSDPMKTVVLYRKQGTYSYTHSCLHISLETLWLPGYKKDLTLYKSMCVLGNKYYLMMI